MHRIKVERVARRLASAFDQALDALTDEELDVIADGRETGTRTPRAAESPGRTPAARDARARRWPPACRH